MEERKKEVEEQPKTAKEVLARLCQLVEKKLEKDEGYQSLLLQGEKKIWQRRTIGEALYQQTAQEIGLDGKRKADFDYQLLVSSTREESSDELRRRYIVLTKDIIEKIVRENYSSVVFLDKSARPVSWFINDFWDIFAGDRLKPDFKFVNIDKTLWNPIVGTNEPTPDSSNVETPINVNRAPFAIIKLAGIFKFRRGEKVLIVDEVKSSGDTLEIARQFFTRAYPEIEVRTWYWMKPKIIIGQDGVSRNEESPVWYRRDVPTGRGIIDPWQITDFLSRRPKAPDTLAMSLRQEIRRLADEVRCGYFVPEYFF